MGGETAKQDYQALYAQRDEIEAELGPDVTWMELPDRKASRIAMFKSGIDPMDEELWPFIFQWMQEKLEVFDRVFRSKIRDL